MNKKKNINIIYRDWNVGENYEIIKPLGHGAFAYVAEAIDKRTGKKVAIKKIDQIFSDIVDCKRILRQITLLRMLNHPNLIKIFEIICTQNIQKFNCIYIVTEYLQTDLRKLLMSQVNFKMDHIILILYEIVTGIRYLHSANVLHRDLKPANILINEDGSVKICDFGLARSVDELNLDKKKQQNKQDLNTKKKLLKKQNDGSKKLNKGYTSHVVTRWYRAPQIILLEKNYTGQIDVWSIGCIFAQLLYMLNQHSNDPNKGPLFPGNSCFPLSPTRQSKANKAGQDRDQISCIFDILGSPTKQDMEFVTDEKAIEYLKCFQNIKLKSFRQMFPYAPDEAIDFLEKTIVFSPYKRMTIDQALQHPIFTNKRDQSKQYKAKQKINLQIEQQQLNINMLREHFIKELSLYNK